VSTVQTSTPRQRIAAERARHGTRALTAACIALLQQRPQDVSDSLITVLGGEPARGVLDGDAGGKTGYWPRVWAARGLLHAWDPAATSAVIDATRDEAWRVREMAAKVIARHRIGDALDVVAALRADEVERVRAAASRAVTVLTAAGA
jgi:HEAT repeat protein